MKVLFNVLFMSLLFTIMGCKKSTSYENIAAVDAQQPSSEGSNDTGQIEEGLKLDGYGNSNGKNAQPNSTTLQSPIVEKSTKIIKDGYMEINVKQIENVKKSIDTILKNYNAYYENEQYSNSSYQSSYSLKIRIKEASFDKMISNIITIDGIVKNKNINARDVTNDYYDTESRMNSAKKYLNRYYDLLSKAKSIKDIMEIEEKIQTIQIEIDSYEGRLKYMKDQISYSTLNLTLAENHEYYHELAKEHFGKKLVNAFKKGGDVLANITLAMITLWPLVLILVLIWIFKSRILVLFRKK